MYTLPELTYDYDALQKSISRDVMELHHAKHHQTYVDKLNDALEDADVAGRDLEWVLSNLDSLDETVQTAVRNNGGGHYNHSLFWQVMSPDGGGEPGGEMARTLIEKYGSFQQFVDTFSEEATGLFGSGWVWLTPQLEITTSPNQDNPLMDGGEPPLLGLDVWEHAYYLDYKNQRDHYIKAWWDVVDWSNVEKRYASAIIS